MEKNKIKSVVLVSGGMDSCVTASIANIESDDISFLHANSIMTWIIKIPTVAGKKAIMIGVALGIVGTSLRIIFGKDKSFLGD